MRKAFDANDAALLDLMAYSLNFQTRAELNAASIMHLLSLL